MAMRQGKQSLRHSLGEDSLKQINEFVFPPDSATAWQNRAQVGLEWNRVGGWALDFQGGLSDLYRAFMDVNLADERLYARRKE
eukprot:15454360-Alexandrium_andersonii.AAC.1